MGAGLLGSQDVTRHVLWALVVVGAAIPSCRFA